MTLRDRINRLWRPSPDPMRFRQQVRRAVEGQAVPHPHAARIGKKLRQFIDDAMRDSEGSTDADLSRPHDEE